MAEIPQGILYQDQVTLLGNHAITVYNRGYYGLPESEGVKLTGFEALHLLELGRISVVQADHQLSEQDLMVHFSQQIPDFMGRYLVYKDLRNRGYIVNQGSGSSFFFRLYLRGDVPKKDTATYYVTPLREGSSINLTELDNLMELATASNKDLVVGLVDASGDVSYLKISQLYPPSIRQQQQFVDPSSWDWEAIWADFEDWSQSDKA